jgi:uncharacterized membrane protein
LHYLLKQKHKKHERLQNAFATSRNTAAIAKAIEPFSICADYNQRISSVEETNRIMNVLQTPLIGPMGVEQVSVKTNEDEPIWSKILCFLGGVYPILRENGKCKCNWETVGWCIVPFGLTSIFFYFAGLALVRRGTWGTFIPLIILFSSQLSISYTRKRFSDAIVGEENRSYVNTLAKRYTLGVFLFSLFVSFFVPLAFNIFFGIGELASSIFFFQLAVTIQRCCFLVHTSITPVKTELLEMVKGTEVEELQTKLLEINKTIQEAMFGYLQVPLIHLFFFAAYYLCILPGIRLYSSPNRGDIYFVYEVLRLIIGAVLLVTPLWLLTRIEKFYRWTLRELLYRNTVMPQTEQTNLLVKYDTIAPRAKIFGMYITRGRVASIFITIVGFIAPKIGMYMIEKQSI